MDEVETLGSGSEYRVRELRDNELIERKFGFERLPPSPEEHTGYLLNMHASEMVHEEDKRLVATVDYFFLRQDGSRFKLAVQYNPYFYVLVQKAVLTETLAFLGKKFSGHLASISVVHKEDLDLPNHLVGLKQSYIKLEFPTVTDLIKVRKVLMPAVKRNRENRRTTTATTTTTSSSHVSSPMSNVLELREYDVPYHMRVSIDLSIFVGSWYSVLHTSNNERPVIRKREDLLERPDCIVLAFDIETTKLPLKFPDANIDAIMMISYMIDGQGYLITNRAIVSKDVDDFEFTPKPEFEGNFVVFNEPDEMSLLQRFFDHILETKPHIFVTYNGDFFDWPFVEARAAAHNLDLFKEIGFKSSRDGVYCSRASAHMDAFCWVKRDSYLPIGSQNLKAAAKAKLRYDPVELDPEDMCRMAAEQPQDLANYSVSDAVATYYLYMKYVHPFCYALCTIIPMQPDEVLRKGSGTLCESLLCVQAFNANIIFPNKHESVLNKQTEKGQVLDSETYVGGHVEAIESGVFRADLPCRFRLVPEAFEKLMEEVEGTMKRAIEVEEGVPLDQVENFEEVVKDIKDKLAHLRDVPARLEKPIIYHLDVGAMYPNIILTNRLQPSAMVDESDCAACDFNRPGARCQRSMPWMWRGEVMPASRSEFQRIQQQLETEKFPPLNANEEPRAFHKLTKEEQAHYAKKRLQDYCRKAYKKTHVTVMEERTTTVCQRENSFYVDTVRNFRDRRYKYKGLCKVAKKEVSEAQSSGDASWLKSAKNKEVLYDSLQLAHKCILNSFYGYVMRKGARWYSMEMAGIVCYTGASIIKCARELIEQIGRPLELDTDGIWCVLPASFPENFVFKTKHEKKSKLTISYIGAVLNAMVQVNNTNDQYHELVDAEKLEYKVRSENSIFFEVDGPYLAMILPASKEDGKKLKKRYAVFNFDGSLAELKGFEVKRRGELQIIKIFQSTVFEAFLKGSTLESCYASVALVADYWLDVLYSHGANMPDSELFELIAENKSMSKTLADYEGQKSTSISTAKRLAEFLGDQMVKDAGLSCRYIISKRPEGAPVTQRAIPLAIFDADESVKRHYLRKWLKDSSMSDFDIRKVLDWNYYIERLGSTIQKIITIPAALQGLSNPVVRVQHPDWLHKRVMEKNDTLKQRKITELFKAGKTTTESTRDIEDITSAHNNKANVPGRNNAVSIKRKRDDEPELNLNQSWREALGKAPSLKDCGLQKWLEFQKRKWAFQAKQRKALISSFEDKDTNSKRSKIQLGKSVTNSAIQQQGISGFIRRAQRTLLDSPWQIIQVMETQTKGHFKLWVLVNNELRQLRLNVNKVFYVNQRSVKNEEQSSNKIWRKVQKTLPRSRLVMNLYEYKVDAVIFEEHVNDLITDLSTPDVEGIYETQMPLDFRSIVHLGCLCMVDRKKAKEMVLNNEENSDTFQLDSLNFKALATTPYLPKGSLKTAFLYQHKVGHKAMYALFLNKRAIVIAVDTVRSNQMPNLTNLYNNERKRFAENLSENDANSEDCELPEEELNFEVRVETSLQQVFKHLQRALNVYREEKKGATAVLVQSQDSLQAWCNNVSALGDFPLIPIHVEDSNDLYSVLDWQRRGAKHIIRHFLKAPSHLRASIEQCRYLHVPVGNLCKDVSLFGCDLLYARHLRRHNFVLWASESSKPDLGGKENDDHRMSSNEESEENCVINESGFYNSICVELEMDALAITAILQTHNIHDAEGTADSVTFDAPQVNLEQMLNGGVVGNYEERVSSVSSAFRVMRTMVNAWLREVSQFRNVFADQQIVHFYRWLRSPQSLLYDPALHRCLLTLMKKLFLQLIGEFRRLGAIVIFADYSRIIVCTKKKRLSDALAYVEYVSNAIRNKELFHSIDLKFVQAWDQLMWLDATNYGGVRSKAPTSSVGSDENKNDEVNMEESNLDDDDDELPEIEMHWHLANYLPEEAAIRTNFRTVVAGYIGALYQFLGRSRASTAAGDTPIRRRHNTSQTPNKGPQGAEEEVESVEQYARALIANELRQRLLTLVVKMDRKLPRHVGPENHGAFPRLPGLTSSELKHPALEFIKVLTKALSVDTSIEAEVGRLRRDLLRAIKVGEFSPEAEWSEPCNSFVLPEVICRKCNHCRDLDLCRDLHQSELSDGTPVWLCSAVDCRAPYDNSELEALLIDVLHARTMSHVLQDLRCTKCRDIKERNLSTHCSCAGAFETLVDADQVLTLTRTLASIAQHHRMSLLEEEANWVLQMHGQYLDENDN